MSVPLCIDLDGTLIKTDSLFELTMIFIKKNPLNIFIMILWLYKGIANLKHEISKRICLDPATLPYSTDFLEYLKSEYSKGRELILVTAADKKLADAIANHLKIFSDVWASDGITNLKGDNKKNLLTKIVGSKNYDYAGNDISDLKVWSAARHAIIVNTRRRLIKKATKVVRVEKVFPCEKNKFISFFKAIRIYQYIKNVLVFVPLFISHLFLQMPSLKNSFIAFIAFCLTASSAYLVNDLLDLEADRQHRTKFKRPLASGDLSIKTGIITSLIFLICAVLLSLQLNNYFLTALFVYFVLTTTYSFYLKKKVLLDVFMLAILYTLRIIAGVIAIQTEYSEWLISFSIFFFLSLAYIKRYSELSFSKKENKPIIKGRGYHIDDLNQLSLFGTVSGYVSIVVFAFYISSSKVTMLYHHPQWLWSVCLLLLYWISRMWMFAARDLIHEDPILFALKDKFSLCVIIMIGFVMILASL